ncbi:MAG: YdcF family protein, partial [Actinomycetota bacterium]
TLESLRNLQDLASRRGLDRLVIVSDPLHLARSQEMATDLGYRATVSRPPDVQASPVTLLRETLTLTYYRFFQR